MLNKVIGALWRPALRPRFRRMRPHGLCAHTSGRSIVKRAARLGVDPVELALKWYRGLRRSGVHFVIAHDGTVYQMLDANIRGAHVGISRNERKRYLSGRWANDMPSKALELWMKAWPGKKSPQHLYPAKSPNDCYVGVEMLPLLKSTEEGHWFTPEQHESLRCLYEQLALMYRWPLCNLSLPNTRFLGHEDIDAYARWQKSGGWDPGALRESPRFSWSQLERK